MIGGIEYGWLWLIGGVVLLIAEVIAPGFFLVFIGAAADRWNILASDCEAAWWSSKTSQRARPPTE